MNNTKLRFLPSPLEKDEYLIIKIASLQFSNFWLNLKAIDLFSDFQNSLHSLNMLKTSIKKYFICIVSPFKANK